MNKVKFRLDDGQIEVVDDKVAEILRKKTPAERLRIAFGMWRSARILLLSNIKSLHPEWDEKRMQKEAAKRLSHGAV
ncbi:MAG: hypothetical protein AABY84_13270 [Candidatus Firestonebacteria bacterium]